MHTRVTNIFFLCICVHVHARSLQLYQMRPGANRAVKYICEITQAARKVNAERSWGLIGFVTEVVHLWMCLTVDMGSWPRYMAINRGRIYHKLFHSYISTLLPVLSSCIGHDIDSDIYGHDMLIWRYRNVTSCIYEHILICIFPLSCECYINACTLTAEEWYV